MTSLDLSLYVAKKYYPEIRNPALREGRREGRAEGRVEGRVEDILTVLKTRGIPVSREIRQQIRDCKDSSQLKTWLKRSVTVASAEDVVI
jgi:predicted transposase YdaD